MSNYCVDNRSMNHGPLAHYLLAHYDVIVVDNAVMVGGGWMLQGGHDAHVGVPEHMGEC